MKIKFVPRGEALSKRDQLTKYMSGLTCPAQKLKNRLGPAINFQH